MVQDEKGRFLIFGGFFEQKNENTRAYRLSPSPKNEKIKDVGFLDFPGTEIVNTNNIANVNDNM